MFIELTPDQLHTVRGILINERAHYHATSYAHVPIDHKDFTNPETRDRAKRDREFVVSLDKIIEMLHQDNIKETLDNDTYIINVAFYRSISEDLDIATFKYPDKPLEIALSMQLCDELQGAFNSGMAGRFEIKQTRLPK